MQIKQNCHSHLSQFLTYPSPILNSKLPDSVVHFLHLIDAKKLCFPISIVSFSPLSFYFFSKDEMNEYRQRQFQFSWYSMCMYFLKMAFFSVLILMAKAAIFFLPHFGSEKILFIVTKYCLLREQRKQQLFSQWVSFGEKKRKEKYILSEQIDSGILTTLLSINCHYRVQGRVTVL